MRKLWALKVKGSRTPKNKPLNTTKASSKIPKQFLVCFLIAIIVQRSFVEL